jgi:antitoxin HigA-1
MSRLSGASSVRQRSSSSAVNGRKAVSQKFVPAPPIWPGEVLRKHLLAGPGITQEQLADAMGVSRFSVNQIINGRRTLTAEMALRLARVTSTTAGFWLNLQRDVDLYEAQLALAEKLDKLPVLRPPKSENELFRDVVER